MKLEDLFQKAGLGSESIQRVKLARGIAGKLYIIALVVVTVIGVLVTKFDLWYLIAGGIVVIILFAVFIIICIMKIGREHPDIALLEGAEFLLYHQKLVLGAKGLESPPKVVELQSDPEKPKLTSQEETETTTEGEEG